LVWQWGRRGAGPRFAAELTRGFAELPDVEGLLSLSYHSEILRGPTPPFCDLPVATYRGAIGFVWRMISHRALVRTLVRNLATLQLDAAVCAMPGPLDLAMAAALRRVGVPFLVLVHDADAHPGDGLPFQMMLQRRLIRRADGLAALTAHVAARLRAQGLTGGRPVLVAAHPPFAFDPPPPPPLAHGGTLRLLSFGRLLPYKGLDLLDEALALLGPRPGFCLRIIGQGPQAPVLDRLARRPGVSVENRWVPEAEIGELLAWADAVVLSHREASQSGVAALAVAAGRWLLATRVGGLAEQLRGIPSARLCEPRADSLAQALAGLLDDPGSAPVPSDAPGGWRALAEGLAAALPRRVAEWPRPVRPPDGPPAAPAGGRGSASRYP
jgi:glycosyltransferase involved in cell wall biosynthesis